MDESGDWSLKMLSCCPFVITTQYESRILFQRVDVQLGNKWSVCYSLHICVYTISKGSLKCMKPKLKCFMIWRFDDWFWVGQTVFYCTQLTFLPVEDANLSASQSFLERSHLFIHSHFLIFSHSFSFSPRSQNYQLRRRTTSSTSPQPLFHPRTPGRAPSWAGLVKPAALTVGV